MIVSRIRHWLILNQVVLMSVAALVAISEVSAHEGPPFPILVDKPLADYMVSVWADPDIGEAQFFIILESADGGLPRAAPRQVTMWVEPAQRRLARVTIKTERRALQNQMQFEANPYFDQQDEWNIGFQLTDNNGSVHEITSRVESTPPGYGPWDFAIYLFPFLLLAAFWALGMIRRKTSSRLLKNSTASTSEPLRQPDRA